MATRTTCNGCGKDLKGSVYYSIGEIQKEVPGGQGHIRFLINTAVEKVEAVERWVSYEDIDLCLDCIKQPVDVWKRIQELEKP